MSRPSLLTDGRDCPPEMPNFGGQTALSAKNDGHRKERLHGGIAPVGALADREDRHGILSWR